MNTSNPSPTSPTTEATNSFQPDDHAQMILFPVLLILGAGLLFFGPGTLFENGALAAMPALFAILTGDRLYRRWTAVSGKGESPVGQG